MASLPGQLGATFEAVSRASSAFDQDFVAWRSFSPASGPSDRSTNRAKRSAKRSRVFCRMHDHEWVHLVEILRGSAVGFYRDLRAFPKPEGLTCWRPVHEPAPAGLPEPRSTSRPLSCAPAS